MGEAPFEAAASAATATHGDRPLDDLISPLLGGTENFRSDEAALEGLIGAADVKWIGGRGRLAPTHEWGTFSKPPTTDLRHCHRTPQSNQPPTDLITRYVIPKTNFKVSIFPVLNVLNVLVFSISVSDKVDPKHTLKRSVLSGCW